MSTKPDSLSSIDQNHEQKRQFLSKSGLLLVLGGGALFLFGVYLFLTSMFSRDFGESPGKMILAMILIFVGSVCVTVGMPALLMANAGRILRFQLGESLPVAGEAAQRVAPLGQDLTRGMAKAVREGWEEGGAPGLKCDRCGTQNDRAACFCNQCGAALGEPGS